LTLEQLPKGSYRTNVDAVLLAAFASVGRSALRAFDLGAGVGPVGLLLVHHRAAEHVTLVELDPKAAGLALANCRSNGFEGCTSVEAGDVSAIARAHAGEADLVVANPPYFDPSRGRPPTSASKRAARTGSLDTFVLAARTLAGRRARIAFVYPADALVTLVATFRASGLEPKRIRFVHATRDKLARIVLVEASAAKAGGLQVLPPLIERDEKGPSIELDRLLRGKLGS